MIAAATASPTLTHNEVEAVRRTVRAAQRRLWLQRATELSCTLALALVFSLCAFTFIDVLVRAAHWPLQSRTGVLAWVIGGIILFFGLAHKTLRRPISLRDAAAHLDLRAQTRDRFQTALDFAHRPDRSPLEALALAECARFVAGFHVEQWTPIRPPRSARALLPLAVSAGLLLWADHALHRPAKPTALDTAVGQRADDLQKIAAKLKQSAEKNKTPELDKVAAEMKRATERLKDQPPAADEQKLKAALGELSSLEAMLNALKNAKKEQASPAELAALAAALASAPQTQAAAEALRAGQMEQAASELEKLLEQLKQNGDPQQTMQQLAKSMQEQAAKLSEEQKNELARQMQQAAQGAQSGQAQLSQQAMQRLAELLRKAGQNGANRPQAGGNNGQGQPMTAQQLQDLLNALENMKASLRPSDGQGGKPGQSNGDGQGKQGLAIVEAFGKPGEKSSGAQPAGMPGGEHDEGHSEDLFAAKPPEAAKPQGPATRLEGLLGEGESLQQLTGAGADQSKSTKGYRDLYDAIAPAEQQAVEQENIPLGSRYFIRRYFENIRPRE